jgi:hypothetical protein
LSCFRGSVTEQRAGASGACVQSQVERLISPVGGG